MKLEIIKEARPLFAGRPWRIRVDERQLLYSSFTSRKKARESLMACGLKEGGTVSDNLPGAVRKVVDALPLM